jgi:thymidylate kinase
VTGVEPGRLARGVRRLCWLLAGAVADQLLAISSRCAAAEKRDFVAGQLTALQRRIEAADKHLADLPKQHGRATPQDRQNLQDKIDEVVEVIEKAHASPTLVSPRPNRNVLLSVPLGLLLGIPLAYHLERRRAPRQDAVAVGPEPDSAASDAPFGHAKPDDEPSSPTPTPHRAPPPSAPRSPTERCRSSETGARMTDLQHPPRVAPAPPASTEQHALALVRRLCRVLDTEDVAYCHWKSNEALDRSASGDNDLDFLVARRDVQRFTEVLHRLGFKEARLPPRRELPAVLHYYGLDDESGRLVHVHAQYQLIVGDDTTKNCRLPIEEAYLASAVQGPLFRVPSPEFELAVLVIRMVLKHASWDAIVCGRGRLSGSERRELADLTERADPAELARVVRTHLPFIDEPLWQRCRSALEPGRPPLARAAAARHLTRALAAHLRRPAPLDTPLRVWRRILWGTRRHVLRRRTRKKLAGGGAIIAVVGGDGAGKSTVVEGLSSWLAQDFAVRRIHLGKPPKSTATLTLKGGIAVGRLLGMFGNTRRPPWASPGEFLGYAWLLWHLLTARDRRREYARAQRFASNGGIVVSDRYPLPQLRYMDGRRTTAVDALPEAGPLARMLAGYERRCYAHIREPDVLLVLRVDPEVAVARRTDEDPDFVRPRSQEVWQSDWTQSRAHVVDASRPMPEVLAAATAIVWSQL